MNVDDLLAVISAWGTCDDPSNCPTDITGVSPAPPDGVVDVNDLLLMINQWGACPGFTGDGEMPQSVEDCISYCSTRCEENKECWVQCVDDCVTALCEADIIECED